LTLDNVRPSFGLYLPVWVIILLPWLGWMGIIFLAAGLSGMLVNVGYYELTRCCEQKEPGKVGSEPPQKDDEVHAIF